MDDRIENQRVEGVPFFEATRAQASTPQSDGGPHLEGTENLWVVPPSRWTRFRRALARWLHPDVENEAAEEFEREPGRGALLVGDLPFEVVDDEGFPYAAFRYEGTARAWLRTQPTGYGFTLGEPTGPVR